ncbi:hypothetical protein ACMA1I_20150 [Pontibacter sp. 13R65]|uniref:hypothetical protein n=1 Tax=Pontibacter sp. 13R65 TaxID=3127458 RepID=UPI00301E0547
MAPDAENHLIYYLLLHTAHKADLGAIRHWDNLKVAFDGDHIWLKNFTYAQLDTVEVKSIPFKAIFYENRNKLYRLNSLLPDQQIPNVHWAPISRALPVEFPSFNHNYFGTTEKVAIKLLPKAEFQQVVALITTLKNLQPYLETAPAVRLQRLRWTLLDGNEALLLGTPLLPVPGETYWQHKDFLLPSGLDFEFPIIADALQNIINPTGKDMIIFQADATYFAVPKSHLLPLTLSSFRLGLSPLSLPKNRT